MNLERQVSNLELSKKLKELGVKQESLFEWVKSQRQVGKKDWWHVVLSPHPNKERYSAFTVAELGILLPAEVNGWYWHSCSPRGGSNWLNWYEDEDGDKMKLKGQLHQWLISDDNEANSRAKTLIYLLENKLIIL